ncbi:MAG: polysaccharide biosynthesis tyrosine autokinase [Novipirellula sp. JB048]
MVMATTDTSSPFAALDIDVLGMLRRRWGLILLGLVLGLSSAMLYQYSTTPIYEADIEILVGQRTSELASSGTSTSAYASGDAIQEDQLATHMRLFASRRILSEAIENHQLDQLASFVSAREKNVSAVNHLLAHLSIRRGGEGAAKGAMVLVGTYRDPNSADAAKVLDAVYNSYSAYVKSQARNTSDEAIELIVNAQATHEKELAEADNEYRQFIASVPVLLEGDQVRDIHKERLSKIETELNEVRSSLAEAKSRLELIDGYIDSKGEAEIDQMDQLALMSQKEVTRLKFFLDMTRGETQSEAFQAEQPVRQEMAKAQYSRLLDLLQTERTMAEEYGTGHPMVEATRRQIEVIESYIDSNQPEAVVKETTKLTPAEMLRTYTRLLRNDVIELGRREEILVKQSEQELAMAKRVEGDFLKGNALRSRLSRAQLRYNEVFERLQEINLAGSYAGFSTDILGAPEVERSPAWPRLPIVMLFGLVLGTVLGLSFSVLAEAVDSTFRDAMDLEASLGAPVICHVPRFDTRTLKREHNANSSIAESVPTFHAPRSTEAEIYRVARTALMLKNRRGGCQTMVVTSPHPGDGKSTTISNLAVSFAQAGKKVLLIDADMRRPTIATVFGSVPQPGLADVLLGANNLRECCHQTDVPNLTLMPHGVRTSEPAELLESARFIEMMDNCRNTFDLILIDAPPLLAVADPAIIAPHVDSVLLTVRVRKNGRRSVERASQLLREMSIAPVGLIVNSSEERGGKSYGYSSGYRNDEYSYVGYYHEYYGARPSESSDFETGTQSKPDFLGAPAIAGR